MLALFEQGAPDEEGEGEVSELEEHVMMAAQAQDQVKYGIVRDPKVVAKMEAAAEAQYATPSIHLFRRLDKQNLTMPSEVSILEQRCPFICAKFFCTFYGAAMSVPGRFQLRLMWMTRVASRCNAAGNGKDDQSTTVA